MIVISTSAGLPALPLSTTPDTRTWRSLWLWVESPVAVNCANGLAAPSLVVSPTGMVSVTESNL